MNKQIFEEAALLKEVDAAYEAEKRAFKRIQGNPNAAAADVLAHLRADVEFNEKKNEYQKITGKAYSPPGFREKLKRLG